MNDPFNISETINDITKARYNMNNFKIFLSIFTFNDLSSIMNTTIKPIIKNDRTGAAIPEKET